MVVLSIRVHLRLILLAFPLTELNRSVVNPVVLAFGFANLAALGWLAAAAAPILIHLWMRQTHRETAWAAIRFLQAALERQARRLRLQHWLLLAVRTAILILIALAAAKPFLEGGPFSGAGGAPTHRVLVVDTSLSMGYSESASEDETVTRLLQAKRWAKQLVGQANPGDVFSLVTMANETASLIGSPVADSTAVKQAIDRIEPTHTAVDLAGALSMANALLQTNPTPANSARKREVIFFTDLDANGWEGLGDARKTKSQRVFGGGGKALGTGTPPPLAPPPKGGGGSLAQTNGVRQIYEKLTETASVTVMDVGRLNATNTAVTQLRIADAAPTSGRPLTFVAEATLFRGDSPRETVAQLLVDGQQVAEQRLTLSPNRPVTLEFVHTIEGPGWRSIQMQLDADALPADDSGYLAANFRPQIRVLCVAGARGAARYLVDALSATGEEAKVASPYLPLTISDADLPTVDLEDFDCLFFCNVAELSRGEANRLQRYLQGGGGVVFFLGDRVDAARYNEVFHGLGLSGAGRHNRFRTVSQAAGTESQLLSVLPVKIGEAITRPSFGIDPLGYAHPIAAPFRDQQRAGLLTTPVSRYYQLILPEKEARFENMPQIALALSSGDPLLVTHEVETGGAGGGRIAVMATAGSLASIDPATGEPWTAMPAWPSFLPIVRGLVQYVSASGSAGSQVVAGQPLNGWLPSRNALPDTIRVERPDDREEIASVSSEGEWLYTGTNKIGVYHFVFPDASEPLLAIAVNGDPKESSLRRVATDRLPESLIIRSAGNARASSEDSLAAPASLHRWLLQAALALVLIDTALACYFGRGGGA